MTVELIGTTRPGRYGAAAIDNSIAIFLMLYLGSYVGTLFPPKRSDATSIVIGLSVFGLYFVYYFLFEWLFGATPGKLITGLRIRQLDGSRCRAKSALIRTLTRLIEVNPLLLGGVLAAIIVRCSKRRQRWGDQLANTVVVEA